MKKERRKKIKLRGWPGVLVYGCNPKTSEVESEGSGVQGLAHLYSKFKVSLGNKRPCFKIHGSMDKSKQARSKQAKGSLAGAHWYRSCLACKIP